MKYCMAILLVLLSFNTYAQLIKWVDADGKVHYSDSPPPDDVKAKTTLHGSTSPDASSSAPPAAKTIFEREADLKKEQKTKDEAAQKAAKEQEEANIKQKNCENSRLQLQTLQNTGRIATYDASGERSVMDDDTRQRKTDEAQAGVNKYCN